MTHALSNYQASGIDSPYAWLRLSASVALGTVGGVGVWATPVVLPAVQAEFGVARADASLPFTLTMLGFAFGGIVMGRLQDRFGILVPGCLGAGTLALGFGAASVAHGLMAFAASYGLIGIGTSATFGPLMADISFWFTRHRGIAIAVAAAGNYLAGTIWPPVLQRLVAGEGWRFAHAATGLACLAIMLPLLLVLRRRTPRATPAPALHDGRMAGGLPPRALQVLLCVAGFACCVAMAMPQVHIVAYCGDLGYGVARGAEMLSLMLGFGIVSRVCSGFVADRIGGLATLLLGSAAAGHGTAAVHAVQRGNVALRDFSAVRAVPGRHRTELRFHRAGILSAVRGRGAPWRGVDDDAVRDGFRRLDLGRHLRPHRFLPGGVSQRAGLEPRQSCHCDLAVHATAPGDCRINCRNAWKVDENVLFWRSRRARTCCRFAHADGGHVPRVWHTRLNRLEASGTPV